MLDEGSAQRARKTLMLPLGSLLNWRPGVASGHVDELRDRLGIGLSGRRSDRSHWRKWTVVCSNSDKQH
jgi:hypothetical protein